MSALTTRCIPLSAVELSKFDRQAISSETPKLAARYLQNLLDDTTLGQHTVQIGMAPDGRSFGFLDAREVSETIAPEQIYATGSEHGMVEVQGGPLTVAVALWKAQTPRPAEAKRTRLADTDHRPGCCRCIDTAPESDLAGTSPISFRRISRFVPRGSAQHCPAGSG